MGLAVAALAMVAGFTAAVLASRVAVRGAGHLVARTRLPPFVVGITLVALGTDLPEIANSIVASLEGLGDVNVGDSIGSVVTQMTLVLGLLPLLGGALLLSRRRATVVGVGIVLALLVGAVVMQDGDLSRVDGGLLVAGWVLLSLAVWRIGDSDSNSSISRLACSSLIRSSPIGSSGSATAARPAICASG